MLVLLAEKTERETGWTGSALLGGRYEWGKARLIKEAKYY
jgi:hypothetical protein